MGTDAWRRLADGFRALDQVVQRTHLALLDAANERGEDLSRTPRSWEVEREDFLRGLDEGLA